MPRKTSRKPTSKTTSRKSSPYTAKVKKLEIMINSQTKYAAKTTNNLNKWRKQLITALQGVLQRKPLPLLALQHYTSFRT